jgi:multiple sugar transport system substrate-binding protein
MKIIGYLWLACFCLLLSSCASQKTNVDFVFMRTSDQTQPYWEEVISDFEAANLDINVNLHVFTWDEGRDKIAQMVEDGRPPTLARIATRWAPEYVAAGLVEPVDNYLTDDFRAEFIPLLINKGSQYRERTFGLPVTVSARALYYNKDLFAQAGLDAPPTTWSELKENALKISQLSGEAHGFGLHGNRIETDTYFYYFLWGNGGDVLSADGIRATFNSPQGIEALTYLRDLVEAGAAQPDPTQDDRKALEDGFVSGRFGMVITGPWLAKRLSTEAPTLNYGVAPIPFNSQPATLAAEDTLILFKPAGQAEKAAAWKFVRFLYQDQYRLEYAQREGVLPEKISVANQLNAAGNTTNAFFMELLPTGRFEPLNIRSADIAQVVTEAAQAVYRGQLEPEAALDAAAAKVNELLAYSATSW